MSRIAEFVFSLLLLAATASSALALEITTDTILGPDDVYHGYPIIVRDGVNPPTHLTILPGFRHYYDNDRDVYNGLIALGSSEIEMQGGEISYWEHDVTLYDRSVFTMTGGSTGSIEANDSSKVVIDGGRFGGISASGNSQIQINPMPPSTDVSSVFLNENSHALIDPGDGNIHFVKWGPSTALIRSGHFENASIAGGDTLVTGGLFRNGIYLESPGDVRVRGIDSTGADIPYLFVVRAGTVHLYGTELRFEESGPVDNPVKRVVGFLADGDEFSGRYYVEGTGRIVLHQVPEPQSLILAAPAIAIFARRSLRRRRKSPA